MKSITLALIFVAQAALASTDASFIYSCELEGVQQTGKVTIDSEYVIGNAQCMFFGKGKPELCWRFERHVRVNDIHLALRFSDSIRHYADDNYISLGNIPMAEGGTASHAIKMGILRGEKTLTCTFSDVNWRQ